METTVDVHEASQVAEVRRVAAELARAEKMTEAESGRLALIATEASTNLVKYGKAGTVTLTRYVEGAQHGVQLIAVDSGPGFADFPAAARDGHSTAGSLGIGLGVIMRSSTLFDVYSVPGEGTAMVARVAHAAPRKPVVAVAPFEFASRSMPKKGQTECGDGWSVRDFGSRQLVCVVDGLGHGPLAALASARAIAVFEAARPDATPAGIMTQAHPGRRDGRAGAGPGGRHCRLLRHRQHRRRRPPGQRFEAPAVGRRHRRLPHACHPHPHGGLGTDGGGDPLYRRPVRPLGPGQVPGAAVAPPQPDRFSAVSRPCAQLG
jgi:anti-sigma regulatory factor (Ser/Thr protein kinase)